MNIPTLDEFNSQIAAYTSNLAISKSDIESQLQNTYDEKVNALKEKGQALLEGFIPTEALSKFGFESAGLSISDVPELAASAVKGIGNFADSALSLASNVGQKISSAADTLATGWGGDTSIKGLSDSLTRAGANAEPESIELTNMAASDAVSATTDVVATAGTDVAASATAGALETVGAAADSTGIGAIIGIPLGIIGAALGGYSLVQGFEDLFSKHSDNVASQVTAALPVVNMPQFQAS